MSLSSTAVMKVEVESETCGICGESGELFTPEEHDAGVMPPQVPLRTMLLHINNNKVVPEGRLCTSCIRRTIDAYEFSSALAAKACPPLSEKIRTLRKRLLELTQKIDVFIVVGGQNKNSGGMYNEDDIIMVERDALASAAALDCEDLEKATNAAGESVYQCTICPMSFQLASEYRSHAASHGVGRHCCWTCGAQFAAAAALRDHALLHRACAAAAAAESAPSPPRCPLCGEGFPSRGELAAHARLRHGADAPGADAPGARALCPECLRAVPGAQLAAHRLAHRQAERFVCGYDACILRFPTRNDLMSHIRSWHAGEAGVAGEAAPGAGAAAGPGAGAAAGPGAGAAAGPGARPEPDERSVVPCAHCDRTFGSTAAMKRHARVHRRDVTQDEEWLAPGEAGEAGEAGDVEYLELETLDELAGYQME